MPFAVWASPPGVQGIRAQEAHRRRAVGRYIISPMPFYSDACTIAVHGSIYYLINADGRCLVQRQSTQTASSMYTV